MDLSTTDKLSAMLGSIVPTFLGYISSIVVYEGTSYQWRLCYKDQAFKFIFTIDDAERDLTIATYGEVMESLKFCLTLLSIPDPVRIVFTKALESSMEHDAMWKGYTLAIIDVTEFILRPNGTIDAYICGELIAMAESFATKNFISRK